MRRDMKSRSDHVRNPLPGFITALFFLATFTVFTVMVMRYDVQDIGFNGAPVGFATLNGAVHALFPYDEGCFAASEYIGYFCLGIAGVNALIAFIDFIKARGFRHMHRRYILTMVLYAVVVGAYVLFEFYEVNERPVAAEASYPSSHTLLALCVLYSEIVLLGHSARRLRLWADILRMLFVALMVAMVFMRLLSGVHWLTDICGSILLSLSLCTMYGTFVRSFDP